MNRPGESRNTIVKADRSAESWWRKFLRKRREKALFRTAAPDAVVDWIYRTNKWGDPESVSGSGSNLAQTGRIRTALPALLARHGVRTLLDAPCGDFHWMQHVDLDLACYIGGDIVQALVDRDNAAYGDGVRRFVRLDLICDPLPDADLLLCRDCLVHLDYARIHQVMANIRRSRIPLLLTTSHRRHETNVDKLTGQHRFLNLQRPPFNWPEPIDLLVEDVPSAQRDSGKVLALWRVADLPAG